MNGLPVAGPATKPGKLHWEPWAKPAVPLSRAGRRHARGRDVANLSHQRVQNLARSR
jgi:hypothetical protein